MNTQYVQSCTLVHSTLSSYDNQFKNEVMVKVTFKNIVTTLTMPRSFASTVHGHHSGLGQGHGQEHGYDSGHAQGHGQELGHNSGHGHDYVRGNYHYHSDEQNQECCGNPHGLRNMTVVVKAIKMAILIILCSNNTNNLYYGQVIDICKLLMLLPCGHRVPDHC